jgi:anthranilate phosphoribosyltransferase
MIMSFSENLNRLILRGDLSYDEMYDSFGSVLNDSVSEMDQGALLASVTTKGPVIEEVRAIWDAVLTWDTNLVHLKDETIKVVDNAGTGMDRFKTFNISTAAAIVAASCGAYVARHGSRGISSKCGTVDLLEALGVNCELSVEETARCVETLGIGIFNGQSPLVHPMALGRILSRMHFASILNIAASLANPLRPRYSVRGVYDKDLIPMLISLYKDSGFNRAIVVCGLDENGNSAIDEAGNIGLTAYGSLHEDGSVEYGLLDASDLGLSKASFDDIKSLGSAKYEASRFSDVLSGFGPSPLIDIVALNSALILYVSGISCSIKEGLEISFASMKSGLPIKKLEQWVSFTTQDSALLTL